MRPIVVFSIGGQAVQFGDRLETFSVTDEVGLFSDAFSAAFANPNGAILVPKTDALVEIEMGYEGQELYAMGAFTVDEVSESHPPRKITIGGRSAAMALGFKSTRNQAYNDTTLGAVLKTIAGRYGLRTQVAPALAAKPIKHLEQTFESDVALLARLGDTYGATAKPAGGALVFITKTSGVRADGTEIEVVEINVADHARVSGWSYSVRDRQSWASVRAHWVDGYFEKTQHFVSAGSGQPRLDLRKPYKNAKEAQDAATAKLKDSKRGRKTLSIKMIGTPALCAETPIEVSGIGNEYGDGRWIVTRVQHTINNGGFSSQVEAQRPDDLVSKGDDS